MSIGKDKDRRLYLQKLNSLPDKLVLRVLMRLNPNQLLELCSELNNEEIPSSLESLRDYCDDANFWQDYLIAQGFILPETFPELLDTLREDNESKADVIKTLFFGKIGERASIRGILVNRWNKLSQEGKSTKHLEQAVLDLAYLSEQEGVSSTHKSGKPYVFDIGFAIKRNAAEHESKLHEILDNLEEIDYQTLLETLVDHDAVISGINHEFWIRNFDRIWEFKDLNEQSVASVNDFLKEGDIVRLRLDLSKPIPLGGMRIQMEKIYLYYFDGELLYPVTDLYQTTEYHWVLPKQALPYLIKKNIQTFSDLKELYSKIPLTVGIIGPKEENLILGSKNDVPYEVDDHTFFVLEIELRVGRRK